MAYKNEISTCLQCFCCGAVLLTEFDYFCIGSVLNHVCVLVVHRNYHVFYYLLAGCCEAERDALLLSKSQDYFYLNQVFVSESAVL